MRKKTIYNLIIIILILAIAIWYYHNRQSVNQTSNNTSISTSTTPSVKTGTANLYPNPDFTPGDVITTATKEQICTPGYSSTVRNVNTATKKQVYEEYGISYPQPEGDYEVDHFISLELGGSNDIKNLWPEPANPKPGFHEKDMVENYLHDQLCNGNETLEQVQNEIRKDWYAVYLKISNK